MLLFVCHANICRSPMAERLARLALDARPDGSGPAAGLTVASAGTHARPGDPMHPGAVRVLHELGADVAAFTSRPLSADLLSRAGLVLTATRSQRAFCVRMAPVVLRRTFTIRQFGRLTEALEPGGPPPRPARSQAEAVAALLDRITAVRAGLQPVEGGQDDLADPVNGTDEDMRACAREIQLSLGNALAFIASA